MAAAPGVFANAEGIPLRTLVDAAGVDAERPRRAPTDVAGLLTDTWAIVSADLGLHLAAHTVWLMLVLAAGVIATMVVFFGFFAVEVGSLFTSLVGLALGAGLDHLAHTKDTFASIGLFTGFLGAWGLGGLAVLAMLAPMSFGWVVMELGLLRGTARHLDGEAALNPIAALQRPWWRLVSVCALAAIVWLLVIGMGLTGGLPVLLLVVACGFVTPVMALHDVSLGASLARNASAFAGDPGGYLLLVAVGAAVRLVTAHVPVLGSAICTVFHLLAARALCGERR